MEATFHFGPTTLLCKLSEDELLNTPVASRITSTSTTAPTTTATIAHLRRTSSPPPRQAADDPLDPLGPQVPPARYGGRARTYGCPPYERCARAGWQDR